MNKMEKKMELTKIEWEYIHQELSREYWKYLSEKDKEPIFLKNLIKKVNKNIINSE